MPGLLLADVLRAIHYNHPLTIQAYDCLSQPLPINFAALTIYRTVTLESRLPPTPEPAGEGSLLALVAVLADIHTLVHVFEPLSKTDSRSKPDTLPKSQLPALDDDYIPFSPRNETRLLRRRLQKALELWAGSYLMTSTRDTRVLFYFCKMYLTLPEVQILPSLANYRPRTASEGTPSREKQALLDTELRNAPDALKCAWQVLENIDPSTGAATAWLPIAVFYASLVVWKAVLLQMADGSHGSRRVLRLFKEELVKMPWPCCESMAATLEGLIV